MKVAVIGSGISGVMAAYYLARDGHEVTIVDQERHPAMKTSYANGGQLSVSNSETWNTWSNVYRGIKWLFKKDAPLLIRMKPEWAKVKWLAKFMYYTIKGSYKPATIRSIELGLESRKLIQEIIETEGIEFDFSQCGLLHFYKDKTYFQKAIDATQLYESNNCEWKSVTADQAVNIEPTLDQVKDKLVGGVWTESDSSGDIHKFCTVLVKVMQLKYNVLAVYSLSIDDKFDYDEYDVVVVSAGVGSTKIAKSIGDDIDVYPVKGYSITINNVDPQFLPKATLLDDQAKIVTSSLGNRFRVAGTAELNGENYDIPRDRIQPLIDWVHNNFPDIDTSNYTMWTCLRPMTPNMLPIVKQSEKRPNVFYHTGHGHLGWTYSAATAMELKLLIYSVQNQNTVV
jgi:D-amino-acid dehydrogenase